MKELDLTTRVLLIVIALFSMVFAASTRAQDTAHKLNEYLMTKASAQLFGGSVLVTEAGSNLLRKGYGFANLEHRVPNTPETKFRLASITKQFTAMAIMILQEQGKLSVHDAIAKHLPDVPRSWQPITVHQLLTHTAGLMHSWELPDFTQTMVVPSTPDQTIARYKDKPLLSKPGEKYHYSGLGYFLLAQIIEKLSGNPYGTFLREQIFAPLKMNDTGEDRQAPILAHRASGYRGPWTALENAPPIHMGLLTGGGNLYSTIDDLAKWDEALTAGLLISKASYEAMYTPFKEHYAYGWRVETRDPLGAERGRKRFVHGGNISGFDTVIMRFPNERVSIIVLSNFTATEIDQVASDLETIVFGRPSQGAGK